MKTISKPTFLINEQICRRNIEKMSAKANQHNLIFRPHFKTHQSADVGNWFRDYDVNSITVSSVSMAKYFHKNGWHDITIAFPINVKQIGEIDALASCCKLSILLADIESWEFVKKIKSEIGIFIEVDTGYHRTGFEYREIGEMDSILEDMKHDSNIKMKGFLTHSGNTYHTKRSNEIFEIHDHSLSIMTTLKRRYSSIFPDLIASIGDTPSCSLMDNFDNVDEIRPGNFVFYDHMQLEIGSCEKKNISVAMGCPIVSRNLYRNQIIIYGGAVHLSKEQIYHQNRVNFGQIVLLEKDYWIFPETPIYLTQLSQEHGIFYSDNSQSFQIGDVIGIIPVHSCLTANLQFYYQTTKGKMINKMREK